MLPLRDLLRSRAQSAYAGWLLSQWRCSSAVWMHTRRPSARVQDLGQLSRSVGDINIKISGVACHADVFRVSTSKRLNTTWPLQWQRPPRKSNYDSICNKESHTAIAFEPCCFARFQRASICWDLVFLRGTCRSVRRCFVRGADLTLIA